MPAKTVGDRIAHLAQEVGSISALARYSGVSRTLLQGVISRGEEPSQRTLLALQKTTGCSWEWLAEGVGPDPRIDPSQVRMGSDVVATLPPTRLRWRADDPRHLVDRISRRVRDAIAAADPAALAVAVPPALLVAYETGQAIPGLAHLAAIARAAGTTEEALIGGAQ